MMALRWMAAAAVLVLTAPAVCPAQTVQPLFGKKLLIFDAGSESQRKIVVAMTGVAIDVSSIDQTPEGPFLHVFNSAGTSDSACIPLPATGWKVTATTLRYSDPTYANGPCRSVKIKSGKFVKAICKATSSPISYSLDEPAQAAVGVRFISGSDVYCADFGGSGPKDIPNKKFLAKNAAAPLGCPAPAATCP